MTTWELRYRAPRSIDNVQIETFTDDEAEAKALADVYLATLASPSVRFVYVRRIVVARSADHPAIAEKWGNRVWPSIGAALGAALEEDEAEDEPASVPPRSGDLIPPAPLPTAATADGFDDGMSGPRVASPARRPAKRQSGRVGA